MCSNPPNKTPQLSMRTITIKGRKRSFKNFLSIGEKFIIYFVTISFFSMIGLSAANAQVKKDVDKQNFATISFSAGYLSKAKVPSVSIPALGYKFNGVYLGFAPVIRLSSDRTKPFIFTFTGGYSKGGLQPFISYSYYTVFSEAESALKEYGYDLKSEWKLGGGLRYFFNNVPLFLEAQTDKRETKFSITLYKSL